MGVVAAIEQFRVTAWFARARAGMLSVFLHLDAPECAVTECEGL
jgi:hypothetical protein